MSKPCHAEHSRNLALKIKQIRDSSLPEAPGNETFGEFSTACWPRQLRVTPPPGSEGAWWAPFLSFLTVRGEAGARSDIANSLNNLDELQHKASRLNLSARIRHLAQLLTIMELAITFDGVLAAGTAVIPFESHSCGGGTLDESLLQLAG